MLRLLLFGLVLAAAQEAEQKAADQSAETAETADPENVEPENKTESEAETEKAAPQPPRRPKMLVLYEKRNINITHSVWLQNIQRVGDLVLKSADDPNLKLDKYDKNIYHTVFVMAPSVEHFGGNVTEQSKLSLFGSQL